MKIAVVGATGMVGEAMLKVLEERDFPVDELIPVASSLSVGKTITFRGVNHPVSGMEEAIRRNPDIALFSAGGKTSEEWAPVFTERGCVVIDNSSAWRMKKNIPLIVPEVNPEALLPGHKIIANPNCSTIQMMMVLAPLYKRYGIKRIVVSTYQSVTGSGHKATNQLIGETTGSNPEMAYPHQIYNNCLPHCADFDDTGYTGEEIKLVNETRKILGDPTIRVSATCVRVPVTGGHSESINVELAREYNLSEAIEIIGNFPGVVLQDDIANNIYPMPVSAYGKDEVFVGRIRRDFSQANTLNMWVVSDNVRKGAATNAVQIAELLLNIQK